jgi:hypothetical protein
MHQQGTTNYIHRLSDLPSIRAYITLYIHGFQDLKMHEQAARSALEIQLLRQHKPPLAPASLVRKYLDHGVLLLPDPRAARITPLPRGTMEGEAEAGLVTGAPHDVLAYPPDHRAVGHVRSGAVEAGVHVVELGDT